MKKIPTLLTIILLFFACRTMAQDAFGQLQGKVIDGNGYAIAAASVALLKAEDSGLVKMTVTNTEGLYQFEKLARGSYIVAVSAVGHEKRYSSRLEVTCAGVTEAGALALTNRSGQLKAVTVSARKSMVEQKPDRMIVNVDAFVSNTGANALEALEKSPGVQVDKDGNISLKGKQNVMVMIDGRPAYLSGADLANMLRGMQASQLDQIEIMTNPPAKYDAAGNSGIINIKTKKNKQKGFNGNISAGYGQGNYFKTNESLSLNYRNGKVNLFSNYSFNRNDNFQQLEIYRRYKNDDGSTNAIFEQVSFMKRRNLDNNLKLGMDYYLTPKTTLGVVFSGFANTRKGSGANTSYLKNLHAITDSIVYAQFNHQERWRNGSVNLNMRHQFDTTGRELTADLDYIRYDIQNDQVFTNTTVSPNWESRYVENLSGDLPSIIDIYSGKMDYTHPISKETKLEMGWKSSYVSTDNKANYYTGVGAHQQIDYEKTNFFQYKENINAAYISFNKQFNKKWGVQAGLRYENTTYRGYQYGNPVKGDSSFKRSYNSLFPTLYISYNADKNHVFSTNFGRRIDRPSYQNLNPFMFFIDKYTYGSGNPYLQPQFSYNAELSHTYKGRLTTTVNYSFTKNLFNETFDQLGYATIVREGNIGRRENMGAAVNANIPVTGWLTSILYVNYSYIKYSGQLYGEELDIAAGILSMNMNNQFNFKKGWSAELSGWYRSKGPEGQIILMPFGQLSAGVSKQVMHGKGTVKLNIRDIFYTQQPHGDINFKRTEARFRNSRDSRVANITFTYRFGKPLKNGNGQHKKGSAGEEQNRVGGGS
jgi:Outer membrane receptor proteins, mostly Fe transport